MTARLVKVWTGSSFETMSMSGPQGETGAVPNISIGTVGTGTAAVSRRGPNSDPIFDFVLPPAANSSITSAMLVDGTIVDGDISATAAIDPAKIKGARVTFSNADATCASTTRYLAQIGTMSAPRVVTLPAASAVASGVEIIVGDESGTVTATNTLTVQRAGSDTINGVNTAVIVGAYGWRRFVSNGSNKWTYDGGVLRSSSNLADVASASTALANLGGAAKSTVGNLLTSAAAACTAGWSGSATVTYAGGKASMVAPSAAAVAPYAISTSTITPGLPYTATLTVDAASQRDVSVAIWFRAGTTLLGTLTAGNAIPAGTGGVSQIAAVAPATADNVLVYANSVAGSTSDVITWSAPAVWQGSGGTLPFWGAPVQGTIAEPPIRATAASVTAHRAQPVIRITSACTVIIPPAAANVGVKFTLINDSSGTLTINRTSPDTIAGATSLTLPGKGSIEIISDGGNANTWLVLAGRYSANTAGAATYEWDHAASTFRPIRYDSGWRDVSSSLESGASGTLKLRRTLDTIYASIYNLTVPSGGVYTAPTGFRGYDGSAGVTVPLVKADGTTVGALLVNAVGAGTWALTAGAKAYTGANLVAIVPCHQALPTSLPGTTSTNPV